MVLEYTDSLTRLAVFRYDISLTTNYLLYEMILICCLLLIYRHKLYLVTTLVRTLGAMYAICATVWYILPWILK